MRFSASKKTIHIGGGTAQLSRMYYGRSVRFILQEVEALRDKQLKSGHQQNAAL
jgi:hypothetical protein